ncbi:hypothetical protein QZH56_02270 [Streptomyces olivoreticuli]|uniref:hypothetical protein n=1 Tax=Streptomyces olivoreticuli TaxID=68246 RepID=UPI00265A67BF|nr:hypothetical protein [Streptomyces olivoreticuli]WKK24501.1 hypothetical protein QZH56_02270 [Streptomyces olivoreticuli]
MKRPITMTTAAALTGLALFVTACANGGGGEKKNDASEQKSGGGDKDKSSGKDMDDAIKMRQCLRKQGIDAPDPKPGEDPRGMTVGGGKDPEKMQKALEACGGGAKGGKGVTQEMKDKALKNAQCLRAKGFNVPDPKFEGGMMTGLAVPDGADQKAFMEAANKCSEG